MHDLEKSRPYLEVGEWNSQSQSYLHLILMTFQNLIKCKRDDRECSAQYRYDLLLSNLNCDINIV